MSHSGLYLLAVEVTSHCNLACPHCYGAFDRRGSPMPPDWPERIGVSISNALRADVKQPRTHMPYGLIALIGSIALTAVYGFVTKASVWSKALVTGLLLVSLVWRYGLFLQVGLSVFLLLYFTYLKSTA